MFCGFVYSEDVNEFCVFNSVFIKCFDLFSVNWWYCNIMIHIFLTFTYRVHSTNFFPPLNFEAKVNFKDIWRILESI